MSVPVEQGNQNTLTVVFKVPEIGEEELGMTDEEFEFILEHTS